MKYLLLSAAIFLSACEKPPIPRSETNQCIRSTLFQQCLEKIPQGPMETGNSSDWDEVVEACGHQALWTAQRNPAFIPDFCRSSE